MHSRYIQSNFSKIGDSLAVQQPVFFSYNIFHRLDPVKDWKPWLKINSVLEHPNSGSLARPCWLSIFIWHCSFSLPIEPISAPRHPVPTSTSRCLHGLIFTLLRRPSRILPLILIESDRCSIPMKDGAWPFIRGVLIATETTPCRSMITDSMQCAQICTC